LLKYSNKSTSKMQPKHTHRMHLNAVIKSVFPQINGPYAVVIPAKQDDVLISMEVEGGGKELRSDKEAGSGEHGRQMVRLLYVSLFLSFFLFFSDAI
jgi:hypothetical protein